MDYHQNARLTVHSREQLARTVLEQGVTLTLAAARFHVSAKTAAKWVRRYRELGPAGLGDQSSRPHRCPRATSSPLIERVLALRRLRYNGWRIAQALGLSRATASRILRRHGMIRLRSLDPPPPVVRYEHKRPGDRIHFDIKRLARVVQPGHRVQATAPPKPARRRLRVPARCHRRPQPHRLRRHPARPDPPVRHPLLPHDQGLLLPLRHHYQARAHRQRLLLSIRTLPHALAPTARQTPLHQALHPAHQRQSRTIHPNHAQGRGLRPDLPKLRREKPTARPLATRLQLPPPAC